MRPPNSSRPAAGGSDYNTWLRREHRWPKFSSAQPALGRLPRPSPGQHDSRRRWRHAVNGLALDPLGIRDPARRYKLLFFLQFGAQDSEAEAGRWDPWSERVAGQLMVSPDGIHWRGIPANDGFSRGCALSNFFRTLFSRSDRARSAKRFKAYGYSSRNLARRAGCYATSPLTPSIGRQGRRIRCLTPSPAIRLRCGEGRSTRFTTRWSGGRETIIWPCKYPTRRSQP